MLIGNNLIRSSIGRFATITAEGQNVNAGVTWVSPAITLQQAERGFLWKAYFVTSGEINQSYMNVRINGANVFDDHLSFVLYPDAVGSKTTMPWDNMYFPPNSVIDLTFTNVGGGAIKVYGHFVVYRFYDVDLAQDYESPACPVWLKEPPAWLVQALSNYPG